MMHDQLEYSMEMRGQTRLNKTPASPINNGATNGMKCILIDSTVKSE
jgi:hypothetical protein